MRHRGIAVLAGFLYLGMAVLSPAAELSPVTGEGPILVERAAFMSALNQQLSALANIVGPGIDAAALAGHLERTSASISSPEGRLAVQTILEAIPGKLRAPSSLPAVDVLRDLRARVLDAAPDGRRPLLRRIASLRRTLDAGKSSDLSDVTSGVNEALRRLFDASSSRAVVNVEAAGQAAAVRVVSVGGFIEGLRRSEPLALVGAGTEGAIFKDRAGSAWKLSLGVAESLRLLMVAPRDDRLDLGEKRGLKRRWREAGGLSSIVEALSRLLPERARRGWPMKNQSLRHELLGNELLGRFTDRALNAPSEVTRDGFGYKTRWIEGESLDSVIKSKRRDAEEMGEIWRELAYWQRVNERMLLATGYVADLLSPSNLIVTGRKGSLRIVPVDNSLARPTPEVVAWYASHGVPIPEPDARSIEEAKPFVFPAMSLQIVSHRMWGLSYEQALAYVAAYFDLPDPSSAARRLAQVRKWAHPKYPRLLDHANIDRARSESGAAEADELESQVNVAALGL